MKGVIFIAIYHCTTKIIGRSKGQSAVASSAYRSGEKLKNEHDGKLHDYSQRKGVVFFDILLPSNAPKEYQERAILWNSVEQIEKSKNAQLAREVEIALPIELNQTEQIALVHEFVQENFVSKGMCADIAIHNKHAQTHENPHAHIMLTMRPINQNGQWGAKSTKEYILDANGNKQYDSQKRSYKCRKISATNWDSNEFLHSYRQSWADKLNEVLQQKGITEKLSPLSYEQQEIEQIPTIHLGHKAHALEKKGIQTERGNRNREIQKFNQNKQSLGPLQKILSNGTRQEALIYLSNLHDEYVKQRELKQEMQTEKENIVETLLPNAQNSLLRLKKEVSDIIHLSDKRTQIRANKAELKPWHFLKINRLTNQSLDLKKEIAEKSQELKEKWGISVETAPQKLEEIQQKIQVLEQSLKKYPTMELNIEQAMQKIRSDFQKSMLLIWAEFGDGNPSYELPRTTHVEKETSIRKRVSYLNLETVNELNNFTYEQIKEVYTPEQQEKLERFFEKYRDEKQQIKNQKKNTKKRDEWER